MSEPEYSVGDHVVLFPYTKPEFREGYVRSVRKGVLGDYYYTVRRLDGLEVELDSSEIGPWPGDESEDGLTDEILSCLNGWPEGSVGYDKEAKLIAVVHRLCKEHGYGRMGQLVAAIEEIWRDRAQIEKWQRFRQERMACLTGAEMYYPCGEPVTQERIQEELWYADYQAVAEVLNAGPNRDHQGLFETLEDGPDRALKACRSYFRRFPGPNRPPSDDTLRRWIASLWLSPEKAAETEHRRKAEFQDANEQVLEKPTDN